MKWNRLRLSSELTYRLRSAKGRTGLTPNLLCRLGFCLSLEDPRVPDATRYDEDGLDCNLSQRLPFMAEGKVSPSQTHSNEASRQH